METPKRRIPEKQLDEQEEYATRGPFASIFGGPVAQLIKMGFVIPTRKIGNSQAFQFQVENHMNELLTCGAEFQRQRTDL
jgi:hypothetical protein